MNRIHDTVTATHLVMLRVFGIDLRDDRGLDEGPQKALYIGLGIVLATAVGYLAWRIFGDARTEVENNPPAVPQDPGGGGQR